MSLSPITNIIPSLEAMETRLGAASSTNTEKTVGQPTFLDVFSNIINDAAETQAQKSQDALDLMLGDTDNIEEIQTNIAKAEVALDLLVTVKNTVVDAYNEIVKMSI